MIEKIQELNLTDDPLKNILLMAPMLDAAGQNKVFGMMCGLIPNVMGISQEHNSGISKKEEKS